MVANVCGSQAHNQLVGTLNFATDQGARIVIATETKILEKTSTMLPLASLKQEWVVKQVHNSDRPQGSGMLVAVHPCLASHIGSWVSHAGYIMAFSLCGHGWYKLWIVGVYAPLQEQSIHNIVLAAVRTEIKWAEKHGEQVLVAGDLNKQDDALP